MQRTTITLDDDLMNRLDEFMADRRYANRSEAIRDLVRAGLEQSTLDGSADAQCLGAAIYVYDHNARELASRLTNAAHDHHDLSIATIDPALREATTEDGNQRPGRGAYGATCARAWWRVDR